MLIAALLALLSSGVEIRAEPAALRLDRERTAQLRFVAPPGPLSVECSAGTLEQLRETAPGQWRGETVGFAALPLSGGGDAEVRTRPGAVVSVSIGPETFGPLRAGADGTAVVPVVVPPGVDFAQQGGRLIDLHVPRTRTVQLAPLDRELAADRDQEIEIAVAAVSRAGEPLEDAPLQWTTSRGELTRAEAVAPGLYRVRWRIPRGSAGEIFVRASVPGDPSPSEAVVRLVPGAIASIELKALQATAVAGGNAVELSALAVDAAGNPADGPVEFFATGGGGDGGDRGGRRRRTGAKGRDPHPLVAGGRSRGRRPWTEGRRPERGGDPDRSARRRTRAGRAAARRGRRTAQAVEVLPGLAPVRPLVGAGIAEHRRRTGARRHAG